MVVHLSPSEISVIEAHSNLGVLDGTGVVQYLQPVPGFSVQLFRLLQSGEYTFDKYLVGDGYLLTCDEQVVAEVQRDDGRVFVPSAFYFFPPQFAEPVLTRTRDAVPDELVEFGERALRAFFEEPMVTSRRLAPLDAQSLFVNQRNRVRPVLTVLCEAFPLVLKRPLGPLQVAATVLHHFGTLGWTHLTNHYGVLPIGLAALPYGVKVYTEKHW